MLTKIDRLFKQSMVATFVCISTFSTNVYAEETPVSVEIVPQANVFADFRDEYPAVVNYFTELSEQEILSFYQAQYGEALTQERKRDRLVSTFSSEESNLRIVISTQGKVQQVDILVTK